jgi:RNA polymerase sigma-70 factor, ECF subfamily
MASGIPYGSINTDHKFETLYNALRARAQYYLSKEQNARSISPTVLLHEAWISLAKARAVSVADSAHYARLVSRIMRNLLIDHARRKRSVVNGGGMQRIDWCEAVSVRMNSGESLLEIEAAMEKLAVQHPYLAELVELRYFAGYTEEETAQILGISPRSVRRQWQVARLRLLQELISRSKEASDAAA